MLALTRKAGQSIVIGEIIEVTVVEISGEHVKLAVQAPREVPIHRKEIYEQIQAENRAAASLPAEMNVQELLDLDTKK